jgi:predicted outer membrane protein
VNATYRSSLLVTGLLAASALAFSAACGNGDDDDTSPPATDAGTDASTSGDAQAKSTQDAASDSSSSSGYTDAQIVEILVTFDNGEVTEAETASSSASSEDVHTLASDIDNYYYQYSGTLQDYAVHVNLNIATATSADSTSLTSTVTADEASYAKLSGSAFDAAYVSAQIKEHTAILALIDTKLTPAVTDDTLTNIITAQRAQFATTLASLQAITLSTDGGTGTDAH